MFLYETSGENARLTEESESNAVLETMSPRKENALASSAQGTIT